MAINQPPPMTVSTIPTANLPHDPTNIALVATTDIPGKPGYQKRLRLRTGPKDGSPCGGSVIWAQDAAPGSERSAAGVEPAERLVGFGWGRQRHRQQCHDAGQEENAESLPQGLLS